MLDVAGLAVDEVCDGCEVRFAVAGQCFDNNVVPIASIDLWARGDAFGVGK